LSNQALLECRERLASEGVNLAAYNSAENAADLNDLRRALGLAAWNLYGISYGTRLALTAIRDFPQGLRSVVIDSVYPPQVSLFADIPANGARAFGVLFDECAADAICAAAYPNLGSVFFDLVDRFNTDPVTFKVKLHSGETYDVLLNGDGLMGLTFQSLYATSLLPYLPRLIFDCATVTPPYWQRCMANFCRNSMTLATACITPSSAAKRRRLRQRPNWPMPRSPTRIMSRWRAKTSFRCAWRGAQANPIRKKTNRSSVTCRRWC
jgi:pimeloyl-ACP methyl ester carboxylesterase